MKERMLGKVLHRFCFRWPAWHAEECAVNVLKPVEFSSEVIGILGAGVGTGVESDGNGSDKQKYKTMWLPVPETVELGISFFGAAGSTC